MKRIIAAVSISAALVWSVSAFSAPTAKRQVNHTTWVQQSLHEMKTIKVGMTRKQLMKVFTWKGGTQVASRTKQTFAYRDCPHFMVDVEFKPVGTLKRGVWYGPNDRIVKISRPYLEEAVMN